MGIWAPLSHENQNDTQAALMRVCIGVEDLDSPNPEDANPTEGIPTFGGWGTKARPKSMLEDEH